MKLGIMQPYFFPYLGYFDLINITDRWVVFDSVQYIRHGWMNRNRILHPTTGWQYVIVPLASHGRDTLIREIKIKEGADWKERIIGQIQHYKKRAPHFRFVDSLLRECLFGTRTRLLSKLNVECLAKVCEILGVSFQPLYFSEMCFSPLHIEGPGDWALRVSEQLGTSEYVNPVGGEALFDRDKFKAAGISLTLRDPPRFEYRPRGYVFEPNLSVIDALLWNSPDEIRAFLEACRPLDSLGTGTSPTAQNCSG